MIRKVTDVLKEGIEFLKNTSGTYQLDAEILLCGVLALDRTQLFLNKDNPVSQEDQKKYHDHIMRRSLKEPVAYILKRKDFYKDTFYVDKRVLVPRPETEILVEEAVKFLKKKSCPEVLDICCGSGCIGLSIKRDTDCRITLSDISSEALEVAKINAEKLFSEKQVELAKSDLFKNIEGKFDLITANPPYLSESDMEVFCRDELEYEPDKALLSGKTGFEVTQKIVESAPKYLNEKGILMLELGFEGSKFLKDTDELQLLKVIKDLNGIDRVAVFTLHR